MLQIATLIILLFKQSLIISSDQEYSILTKRLSDIRFDREDALKGQSTIDIDASRIKTSK